MLKNAKADVAISNTSRYNQRPVRQVPGSVLPDSAWSWLVVCGNLVLGIVTLGFFRCLSVFFRPIMDEFNVHYSDVASIPGLFCFGLATGSFFLSYLTAKFGYKRTSFAGGLVLGGCSVISSISRHFVLIQIFSGYLSGCCAGLLFFTSIVTSSQYFVKHRSLATGIATIGVSIGSLALPPIVNILVEHFGWRGALLIASGLLFHACVSASLYRPVVLPEVVPKNPIVKRKSQTLEEATKHDKILSEAEENGKVRSDAQNLKKSEESGLDILHNVSNNSLMDRTQFDGTTEDISLIDENKPNQVSKPNAHHCCPSVKRKIKDVVDLSLFRSLSFDFAILSSVFYFCGYVTTNTFLIPFGLERVKITSLEASFILSVASGAECVSKILYGFLGDIKWVNRTLLLTAMATLVAIFLACIPLCTTYSSLLGMAIVYGLGASAYAAVVPVVLGDIVGMHRIAGAIGYQGCLYNCLLAPCLYFIGYLIDRTGDIRLPFFVSSGLIASAAICLLIVYFLQRRKRQRQTAT